MGSPADMLSSLWFVSGNMLPHVACSRIIISHIAVACLPRYYVFQCIGSPRGWKGSVERVHQRRDKLDENRKTPRRSWP